MCLTSMQYVHRLSFALSPIFWEIQASPKPSPISPHQNINCDIPWSFKNTDQSEGMHRLWNRDLASFLSFQHILNDPRYNGTIPERLTRVIQIGRIRRQAEGDLQEGRRLRQRLTRI
ncbi:hypothetical protein F4703DRAFT_1935451 [Phycomyces blakesleeanus]